MVSFHIQPESTINGLRIEQYIEHDEVLSAVARNAISFKLVTLKAVLTAINYNENCTNFNT